MSNGAVYSVLLQKQAVVRHDCEEQRAFGKDADRLNEKRDWVGRYRADRGERLGDREVFCNGQRQVRNMKAVGVREQRLHAARFEVRPKRAHRLRRVVVRPQHHAAAHDSNYYLP